MIRTTLLCAAAALALAGGTAAPDSAEAAPKLCGDRGHILDRLKQAHDEDPQAIGLMADGGVVEVLVAPTGGFTMLVTYPNRPTCVIATGMAFEFLPVAVGEPS